MASRKIKARPPRGTIGSRAAISRDSEILAGRLEDAAHYSGGHAHGVATPGTEAEIATLLASEAAILPIGAQSSLTGGATPMGETLLATSRLNHILTIEHDRVRLEAGVTLTELDAALERAGKRYPPAPTFAGAFVGGTIATNAAGAATFKYGPTRPWVEALTVVLATGDVLEIERGRTIANDGLFEVDLVTGAGVVVPVPTYRMPAVPKVSAGYYAKAGMDLIDLFIGSEGTLGVITEVTLRVLPDRPPTCLAFLPFADRTAAVRFVGCLRRDAAETWQTRDPSGLDIAAVEHMDARCLDLVREDGIDRQCGVTFPSRTAIALLVTIELPPDMGAREVYESLGHVEESGAVDSPLGRFYGIVAQFGALDDVLLVMPGDRARESQLMAFREAVPAAVNARVGRAKQSIDGRIEKTAADVIVPFDHLERLLATYDDQFGRRNLDVAVWGHVSDGNLHPNVIPRSYADVESGREAILEIGREAIRLGGSPLAEHGVGRNPLKQQLLADLYGQEAIEEMRAVKRALDPEGKLAPGVLLPTNK